MTSLLPMQEIRTIGLAAHWDKHGMENHLEQLKQILVRNSLNYVIEPRWVERLNWDPACSLEWEKWPSQVDFIISLGGDGTILNLVQKIAAWDIPLASINAGRLGFLTTCTMEHSERLISQLSRKSYTIENRGLLEAKIVRKNLGEIRQFTALNEVSVVRGRTARMVEVDALVNGELLNHYHADGVLVATPTGSTAYSLSAGGPLIAPGCGVYCITPVCPHSLSNRSLVLSDESQISLIPKYSDCSGVDAGVLFSVDGQELVPLEKGDCVSIQRSPWKLRLVHLPGHNFAQILRTKLRWTGAEV